MLTGRTCGLALAGALLGGRPRERALTRSLRDLTRFAKWGRALRHTFMAAQFEDEDLHAEDDVLATNAAVSFLRVAVTPAQITQYRLLTAPPKPTDVRGAFTATRTCQVEALPPNTLAAILLAAITDPSRFNQQAYNRVLREERTAREELLASLDDA